MNFTGRLTDGDLSIDETQKLRRYLKGFKEDQQFDIEIERHKITRTVSQNRFYWLYLGVISNETGNTAEDLHEYFKRAFLPPRFVHILGKEIKLPTSSAELSKHDFSDYLDKICSLTNVPIPNPEDAGFLPNNVGYLHKT